MSTPIALAITVVLLALNGFFVAAEFALLAAKRHRLAESAANGGGLAARLAVRGSRELTITLAGTQLGITLCSLGLGAIAEPAIAHLFEPLLHAAGLPEQVSYAVAFVVALLIVLFLHMVVGEMVPKSWAISHPERAALAVAVPFEGFAFLTRPILRVLNSSANGLIRLVGVTPQDKLSETHRPEELSVLLRQSHEAGVIPEQQHRILSGVLALRERTIGQLMRSPGEVVSVAPDAGTDDVEDRSRDSGRSRLIVLDGDRPLGIVHVRDALRRPGAPLARIMTPPLVIAAGTSIAGAVATMRTARAQLAVVTGEGGGLAGIVALEDLLEQILGDFQDETDSDGDGRTDRG